MTRCRRRFIPTWTISIATSGQLIAKAVRAFADAGCRYLQLDEVNFAYLCDPKLRAQVAERGEDPAACPQIYARLINAAISDIPTDMTVAMHLCRGNFQSTFVASGGYEPVAEVLFNSINVRRLLHGIRQRPRRRLRAAALRAQGQDGGARPVTIESGRLESKDEIKRRIDQAAKFVPLEQLCLSPQCGFASTEEGNILAEDEQWAKAQDDR